CLGRTVQRCNGCGPVRTATCCQNTCVEDTGHLDVHAQWQRLPVLHLPEAHALGKMRLDSNDNPAVELAKLVGGLQIIRRPVNACRLWRSMGEGRGRRGGPWRLRKGRMLCW